MTFWEIWLQALILILILGTFLWGVSVRIKNASIVDIFWGPGFVVCAWWYAWQCEFDSWRSTLLLGLVTIWGLRLALHIGWRNHGKGEDYRYQQFRQDFGPERYWWFSYFQVFLLQGGLLWFISAPLLAVPYLTAEENPFGLFDVLALFCWGVGFAFEAGGDWQLAQFKANPANKGKVLDQGFWKYTRHPNYFGDAAVWWGYGLFSVASGSYWPMIGPLLMTGLIIQVSGVRLLERTLVDAKPEYRDYVERTSAFIPWPPKTSTSSRTTSQQKS